MAKKSGSATGRAHKAWQRAKVKRVLDEWKAGTLKSSSGQKITEYKQAVAVALSESGQGKK